ncbi:hypothetical protein FMUAM8_42900 [Nocardia cyriacigeorgica]|nr:hypothetical protein FMUAM8_42900 [Nocardia cyriacigeorgica]
MTRPISLHVSAIDADRTASAQGYALASFMSRIHKAPDETCPWQLIGFASTDSLERAAVAWIVADAVMRGRAGHTRVYDLWRTAALANSPLTGEASQLTRTFVRPVFGLPPDGSAASDHVPGHVGEWLWYLLTREEARSDHATLALLEPPSWNVTEGGGDGFVVYRIPSGSDTTLIFRLWEIKKFTGSGSISTTITTAATQLADRGDEYVAKISWANAKKPGELGKLMTELTELWMRADPRGGAGVSVSTNPATAPKQKAFTQVASYLPQLVHPGQLQGIVVTIENFEAFADEVRGYLWSAL